MEDLKDLILKWINENSISAAGIAAKLNITRGSFNNKMKGNGRDRFTIEQLKQLHKIAKEIKDNTAAIERILKFKSKS